MILEAAHSAGVIHRDLKPSNIKIKDEGRVKLLDFGLAKAVESSGTIDPAVSPTITAMGTATGVIVGSAAYMSPEQAKGKAVDRRTDVWAFGCVLYEMLTGQRAFAADSVSETLVAVMTTEIDLDRLPDETPARLRRVLVTCLQKDPTKRVHDMADVRLAMEGAFDTVGSPMRALRAPQPAVWQRAVPWIAGVLLAILTGLGVWGLMRPEPARVARFEVPLDDMKLMRGPAGGVSVALSPDGEHLVYVTGAGNPLGPAGGEELRVRSLSQLSSNVLASTRVYSPFFSPDSNEVGFAQAGLDPQLLQRVSVGGGPISVITRIPPGNSMAGASWSADGTVVFATTGPASGLWRVAASGASRSD